LVVGVAEEEGLGDLLELGVEVLVSVPVRELHRRVLQVPQPLKQLIRNLRVEADCAVLELVEGRVVGPVDLCELLLESVQLVVALSRILYQELQFLVELLEVVFPSFDVFLGFHEEDFLFLVVVLDGLGEGVLPVLEHLDEEL